MPTLHDIVAVLAYMADRISGEPDEGFDPDLKITLRRTVAELELHIPGLDPPPDAKAARLLASSAAAALIHSRKRDALARALRGLSFAPHDPELHYLAASACLELGAVSEAVCLLAHTLWIHPGHVAARHDLETVTAFHGQAPADWQASAEELTSPRTAYGSPSRLELDGGDDDGLQADGDDARWADDDAWMDDPRGLGDGTGWDRASSPDDDADDETRAA